MLKVPKEEAESWCKDNDIYLYSETSAKNSTNIKEAFQGVARGIIQLKQSMEASTVQYQRGILLEQNASEIPPSTDSTTCKNCWSI